MRYLVGCILAMFAGAGMIRVPTYLCYEYPEIWYPPLHWIT